jgi:hypothetical protein
VDDRARVLPRVLAEPEPAKLLPRVEPRLIRPAPLEAQSLVRGRLEEARHGVQPRAAAPVEHFAQRIAGRPNLLERLHAPVGDAAHALDQVDRDLALPEHGTSDQEVLARLIAPEDLAGDATAGDEVEPQARAAGGLAATGAQPQQLAPGQLALGLAVDEDELLRVEGAKLAEHGRGRSIESCYLRARTLGRRGGRGLRCGGRGRQQREHAADAAAECAERHRELHGSEHRSCASAGPCQDGSTLSCPPSQLCQLGTRAAKHPRERSQPKTQVTAQQALRST